MDVDALYLSHFEDSPVLLAITDPEGIVRVANARFRRVFGDDIVGAYLPLRMASVSPGLASFVERLLARGEPFRVEDVTIRAGEHSMVAEVSGSVGDARSSFAVRLIDQSERLSSDTVRAQRQRQETLARFAGGLSHDLSNMLAAIVATAQAGGHDADDGVGDPRADFDAIIDEAERGAALARALRSLAFDETGSWRPVDLAEEVQAAAAVLGRGADGADLVLDLAEGAPEVVGDRARLHQVVLNLLVNGRDAVQDADGIVEVDLDATPDGGLKLVVQDSGPGIPEAVIDRVFEPYFTTKRKGERTSWGTGLGLAIVDAVARTTGAHVGVRNQLGSGACFTVEWPSSSVVTREQPPASQPRSGRVVVLDRRSPYRTAVSARLARLGFEVDGAATLGAAARLAGAETTVVVGRLGPEGAPESSKGISRRETLGQVRSALPAAPVVVLGTGAGVVNGAGRGVRAAARNATVGHVAELILQARRDAGAG